MLIVASFPLESILWWDKINIDNSNNFLTRLQYQGIIPPVERDSNLDFDPGAKYHIPANTPYIRWVKNDVIQSNDKVSLIIESIKNMIVKLTEFSTFRVHFPDTIFRINQSDQAYSK